MIPHVIPRFESCSLVPGLPVTGYEAILFGFHLDELTFPLFTPRYSVSVVVNRTLASPSECRDGFEGCHAQGLTKGKGKERTFELLELGHGYSGAWLSGKKSLCFSSARCLGLETASFLEMMSLHMRIEGTIFGIVCDRAFGKLLCGKVSLMQCFLAG